MEEILKKQGSISWTELSTNDPDAARKFYSEAFGWDYQEFKMPETEYHVIKSGGREVGGIMKMPPQAGDVPPFWLSYVTVDNVDETAKRIESLGGKIVCPPMDIKDVGRMIVFQDPQGALLAAITYADQGRH